MADSQVDHDRLERLAEQLLDSAAIDWERELDAAVTPEGRRLVEHLRVLREIANVHGTTGLEQPPTEGQPARWGNLRIMEAVGRGSFGEVFRAWDEALDREVALKLLHDPASDLAEARRLARVRHPNFVAVYGAEIRDGRAGVWMEFLHGRTLARIVSEDGPFSASEATLIGIDLCRSLAAVHTAGLLHRDVKAQNVVRQMGGRIVLMDLGAGQDRHPGSQSPVAVSGTPLYMAPEVLEGRAGSVESEIYSLGVLLFYLVTGQYPVAATSVEELRRAHRAGRLLLRDLRPDLPQAFVDVVDRALQIDPSRRWQSAGAMEAALLTTAARREAMPRRRAIRATLAAVLVIAAGTAAWRRWPLIPLQRPVTSVAVLPLQNLTGDGEQDYLADGLTEDLTRYLSRTGPLRVISRTSAMFYKAHPKPVREIARDLNVDAVVEGTVRRVGDRVRIQVGLIDGANDRTMWTGQYEHAMANLATLEDELLRAVAHALGHRGDIAPHDRLLSADAYELLLKGRFQLNKRTTEGMLKARELFERAIEREPSAGVTYAALADSYVLLGAFAVLPPTEMFPKAEAAARQAIRLDPTLSQPYAVLGYTLAGTSGVARAEREFKRALELDPGNATAHQWYALTLLGNQRMDDAVFHIEQARSLDPLSPVLSSDVAVVYRAARGKDEALAQLLMTTRVHPAFSEGWRQLGALYQDLGKHREAAAAFAEAMRTGGETAPLLGEWGYEMALAGEPAKAADALRRLHAMNKTEFVPPAYFAILYAALGDEARALDWVKKDTTTGQIINAWQQVTRRPALTRFARSPAFRALPEPR
jgi:serine/threonine-protein kinase